MVNFSNFSSFLIFAPRFRCKYQFLVIQSIYDIATFSSFDHLRPVTDHNEFLMLLVLDNKQLSNSWSDDIQIYSLETCDISRAEGEWNSVMSRVNKSGYRLISYSIIVLLYTLLFSFLLTFSKCSTCIHFQQHINQPINIHQLAKKHQVSNYKTLQQMNINMKHVFINGSRHTNHYN